MRTRSVIHLSLCDSIPAYGPVADMTFSLSKVGVRTKNVSPLATYVYSRLGPSSIFFGCRPTSMLTGTTCSRARCCHGERPPRGLYPFPGTQEPYFLPLPPFVANHSRYLARPACSYQTQIARFGWCTWDLVYPYPTVPQSKWYVIRENQWRIICRGERYDRY